MPSGHGDFALEERCHTKRVETAHAVGADLDTGTFFGWCRALFQEGDGAAGARECQGCGKAGDAGASDQNVRSLRMAG